jgi:site-specific DNA-methyltransferase (adenine-specific)
VILYESERAIVFHGSCVDVCAALGPRAVGVVVTDPPYTEHVHKNIRSCNTTGPVKVKAWEPGFDALADFDHVPALLGVTQRWVLSFCALESFDDYRKAAYGHWKTGGSYVRSGIWRKKQAAPQLSGDRPANSCEGIAVMHARPSDAARMHWNGHGKHAYWVTEGRWFPLDDGPAIWIPADELFVEHGRERAEKRHPAQKPESLMVELVELFSDEGEWILDPYCGSGATGVAALKTGRRVILADQSKDWARFAAEKMAAVERGLAA